MLKKRHFTLIALSALVFSLSILMLIISAVLSNASNTEAKVGMVFCSDSDGNVVDGYGADVPNIKGTVTITDAKSGKVTNGPSDTCTNLYLTDGTKEPALAEYFCDNRKAQGYDWKYYKCNCRNGACVSTDTS